MSGSSRSPYCPEVPPRGALAGVHLPQRRVSGRPQKGRASALDLPQPRELPNRAPRGSGWSLRTTGQGRAASRPAGATVAKCHRLGASTADICSFSDSSGSLRSACRPVGVPATALFLACRRPSSRRVVTRPVLGVRTWRWRDRATKRQGAGSPSYRGHQAHHPPVRAGTSFSLTCLKAGHWTQSHGG